MGLANWDPLESQLSSEVYSATIKRQIKNILKSYTGWFDPLSELIQNALDAVEARRKRDDKYTPLIYITIDLKTNCISVTDTGIGFTEDQFKNFLAPNVSFKRQENRGNKGVGATYLGYGFNYLQIGTKTPDFSFLGGFRPGREWVEDETAVVTRPTINPETTPIDPSFSTIDRGSTFSLKLVGEAIRPRDLAWVGASTADQWEVVLRVRTPLGGVYLDREAFDCRCELRVIAQDGQVTAKTIHPCTYIFPHTVITACKSLSEIRKTQHELIQKGKDASKLPAGFYNLNGLYNVWDTDALLNTNGEFRSLTQGERDLVKRYKANCYGFICYTTEIWDTYNDKVAGLREGRRILRGGLQLATNSMPQGDLYLIPLTASIGYQNVTHAVVHFDSADPDLGRKGFQPELIDLAKRISVLVVNTFLDWRKHLRTETGAPPDIASQTSIHEWISAQEMHEKNNPLTINRKDVFLPTAEVSLTSKPLNEQDVVSLFNQLLAGGVIRGIKVMSTSQHNQYDGVFRFWLRKPTEHHVFHKQNNPLGIDTHNAKKEFLSNPQILEYKYSLDGLIEELEKNEKAEKDIHLLVAWTIGKNWPSRYEITPLLHLDNVQHRYFHGGTHLVKQRHTGANVFPAIILSELIGYINDVDAVQEFQRLTYMS